MGIRYDANGDPFTGIQQYRFERNDSLFSEYVYENGITKSATVYIRKGDSTTVYETEYGYIGNHFKTLKEFKNGVLIEEGEDAESNELGYHKQWHPNGQIRYEATFTGNIQYEGLMTLYDEEGNITEQARYKDGKLVEKIK